MLKKLRIKFVCINMAIVTVMLGIIFVVLLTLTKRSLEQESIQMMQNILSNPMQMSRPNEFSDDIRLPYFAVQIDPGGKPVSVGGGYFDLSDDELLLEILEVSNKQYEQIGILSDYHLRYIRMNTPTGQSVVFADITSEQATLNHLLKICGLIGAACFLSFLGISILLARWAVKPVDEAWKQQRQFVADASHELKTPLTVIMTNAELLQTPDFTEADRRQFSGNILSMSKQMRGLVESLLELARVDNGVVKQDFCRVNFSDIVSDALLPFEPVFFEKGLKLSSKIETDIVLNGSAEHLKQVVDIFLDNAQKYSSPGGETIVTLERAGHKRCLLKVANQGPPVSEEELKEIFKKFYRADHARSMNQSYGLGLSIAQGIVLEHHGRIWAESREGVNSFYAEFPGAA